MEVVFLHTGLLVWTAFMVCSCMRKAINLLYVVYGGAILYPRTACGCVQVQFHAVMCLDSDQKHKEKCCRKHVQAARMVFTNVVTKEMTSFPKRPFFIMGAPPFGFLFCLCASSKPFGDQVRLIALAHFSLAGLLSMRVMWVMRSTSVSTSEV